MSDTFIEPTKGERAERLVAWVVAANRAPGVLFTTDELCSGMGIPPWRGANNVQDFRRLNLLFMEILSTAREALLKDFRVDLQNVWGVGYTIIPPAEQAKTARQDAAKVISKALRDVATRIRYTALEGMTQDERAAHNNSAARADQLASIVRAEMNRR